MWNIGTCPELYSVCNFSLGKAKRRNDFIVNKNINASTRACANLTTIKFLTTPYTIMLSPFAEVILLLYTSSIANTAIVTASDILRQYFCTFTEYAVYLYNLKSPKQHIKIMSLNSLQMHCMAISL